VNWWRSNERSVCKKLTTMSKLIYYDSINHIKNCNQSKAATQQFKLQKWNLLNAVRTQAKITWYLSTYLKAKSISLPIQLRCYSKYLLQVFQNKKNKYQKQKQKDKNKNKRIYTRRNKKKQNHSSSFNCRKNLIINEMGVCNECNDVKNLGFAYFSWSFSANKRIDAFCWSDTIHTQRMQHWKGTNKNKIDSSQII